MRVKSTKKNTEFEKKEKVAIGSVYEPTGEVLENGFNRTWGGYEFSDNEVERLLKGEELTVITSNEKTVPGLLAKSEYKGHEYWGFVPGIPAELCGHRFTHEERMELYDGEKLYIEDFWSSKKCEKYSAYIEWENNDITMSFNENEEE